mmetsp:Transcript_6665/g.10061  ORF Transcript_6665/g.10061 Transcript_6665/m.10061 type:complete len:86 (+) Transcript_6665:82-339(+)
MPLVTMNHKCMFTCNKKVAQHYCIDAENRRAVKRMSTLTTRLRHFTSCLSMTNDIFIFDQQKKDGADFAVCVQLEISEFEARKCQ